MRKKIGLIVAGAFFGTVFGWYFFNIYYPLAVLCLPTLGFVQSQGASVLGQAYTLFMLALWLLAPLVVTGIFTVAFYEVLSGESVFKK